MVTGGGEDSSRHKFSISNRVHKLRKSEVGLNRTGPNSSSFPLPWRTTATVDEREDYRDSTRASQSTDTR